MPQVSDLRSQCESIYFSVHISLHWMSLLSFICASYLVAEPRRPIMMRDLCVARVHHVVPEVFTVHGLPYL